jgi:hypothetical protein
MVRRDGGVDRSAARRQESIRFEHRLLLSLNSELGASNSELLSAFDGPPWRRSEMRAGRRGVSASITLRSLRASSARTR